MTQQTESKFKPGDEVTFNFSFTGRAIVSEAWLEDGEYLYTIKSVKVSKEPDQEDIYLEKCLITFDGEASILHEKMLTPQ